MTLGYKPEQVYALGGELLLTVRYQLRERQGLLDALYEVAADQLTLRGDDPAARFAATAPAGTLRVADKTVSGEGEIPSNIFGNGGQKNPSKPGHLSRRPFPDQKKLFRSPVSGQNGIQQRDPAKTGSRLPIIPESRQTSGESRIITGSPMLAGISTQNQFRSPGLSAPSTPTT